jgi:hypothetical protein
VQGVSYQPETVLFHSNLGHVLSVRGIYHQTVTHSLVVRRDKIFRVSKTPVVSLTPVNRDGTTLTGHEIVLVLTLENVTAQATLGDIHAANNQAPRAYINQTIPATTATPEATQTPIKISTPCSLNQFIYCLRSALRLLLN